MTEQEKNVRRSKIYTYFYGRNTVFQQFLIIVGVLFILLAGIAGSANINSYNSKRDALSEKRVEASSAYSEYFSEHEHELSAQWGKPVDEVKGDELYDEQREYNDLLKDYNKAQEKYEKHASKNPTKSFWSTLSSIVGYAATLAGAGWFIFKKFSFNRDGEQEYDAEIRDLIAAAKERGLEKLNLVAEQVGLVDPVVLSGVANARGDGTAVPASILAKIFAPLLRFILAFDKILLGALANIIILFIVGLIAKNNIGFAIMFVLVLALCAFVGKLVFTKYEKNSHVSPSAIKRLCRFSPKFMAKLGSDDKVRVSLPAFTVYMFGEDQLYVYYQYIDIVTGKTFCEGIREYFYEDIVGINSQQETRKIFKRCGFMLLFIKSIDYLMESIAVVTRGDVCSEAYIVDVDSSILDTQFMGMRNLVRQKKLEK